MLRESRPAPQRGSRIASALEWSALFVVALCARSAVPEAFQTTVAIGPPECTMLLGARALDEEAVEAWAAARGEAVRRYYGALVVRRSARLEGDLLAEPSGSQAAFDRFFANLFPGQRLALAQGRLLRLQSAPATASDLLRCSPEDVRFDPRFAPNIQPLTTADRAELEALSGRPIPDDEWNRRVERNADRRSLAARFGALPHEAVVALGLSGELQCVNAEGRAFSGPIPVLLAPALRWQTVLAPWDDQTYVPGLPRDAWTTDILFDWLDEHRPQPPTITIPVTRLYSLRELVDLVPTERERSVAAQFAHEQFAVRAGTIDVDLFEQMVQMASGLLWRSDPAVGPNALHLSAYPSQAGEVVSIEEHLLAVAEPLFDVAAQHDTPFHLRDLLREHEAKVDLLWEDLTEEQQSWILEHARFARRLPGGGVGSTEQTLAPEDLWGAVVRFELFVQWQVGYVAPVTGKLGEPVAVGLQATGYNRKPSRALIDRLIECDR